MDNAFSWILKTEEQFDIVILSVFDQPWLPPRRTTRIPQLRGFYQRLQALTTPKGIFVQEAGSILASQEVWFWMFFGSPGEMVF